MYQQNGMHLNYRHAAITHMQLLLLQVSFYSPLASLAMTKPDRQLIAQVMLYSQGFRTAERVATKVVPFFK